MRDAESSGYGGTNFYAMTHQKMLEWLDEASEPSVRLAGDRLRQASADLLDVAEKLKGRVGRANEEWKGEAQQAFDEWAMSIVSSTLSLSDYSGNSATWMANASQAIASAKSAIPRYTSNEQAKANLRAAQDYPNDPDSAVVARNAAKAAAASDKLDDILAKEAQSKQEAAAEMTRLSSAYQWSGFYMTSMEPPTFPPPPGEFVPDYAGDRGSRGGTLGGERHSSTPDTRSGTRSDTVTGTRPDANTGTDTDTGTPPSQSHTPSTPDTPSTPPSGGPTGPSGPSTPTTPDSHTETRPDTPVDLGIDSVETLPPSTTGPTGPSGPTGQNPGGAPPVTKPDGGATPPFITTTGIPPTAGKGGLPGALPSTGPVTGGTRGPLGSGRGLPGMPGAIREGISGGRAVPSTQGRPATGIPRGTVIGGETGGRNGSGVGRGGMGMGGGMGGAMGGGSGAGRNGATGRRLAGETGGIVGGKAQRSGGASGGARPFTAGGTGLVRGGTTRPGEEREERNGERPDYLVEDEETWQQGNRRPAPPVID
ncbi:hypothetical protein AB0G79_05910 [Streptomyces sp. NPDC020807]|uniref:hypothetical protein n=1 Tax=Streptomyces sp. NPDC020807 TaxID=3155119 RepID=UPI0033E3E7E8